MGAIEFCNGRGVSRSPREPRRALQVAVKQRVVVARRPKAARGRSPNRIEGCRGATYLRGPPSRSSRCRSSSRYSARRCCRRLRILLTLRRRLDSLLGQDTGHRGPSDLDLQSVAKGVADFGVAPTEHHRSEHVIAWFWFWPSPYAESRSQLPRLVWAACPLRSRS